jgi:hypothetical protein
MKKLATRNLYGSGVQLLGCDTSTCQQPVLLHQFGICNQAGCAAPPELLTDFHDDFDCPGGICRASTMNAASFLIGLASRSVLQ